MATLRIDDDIADWVKIEASLADLPVAQVATAMLREARQRGWRVRKPGQPAVCDEVRSGRIETP